MFEELQTQKTKIREQEKQIEKYRKELEEMVALRTQEKEDEDERRNRVSKDRCASQQNRRSSLLVPKLDLTKVKPYEESKK